MQINRSESYFLHTQLVVILADYCPASFNKACPTEVPATHPQVGEVAEPDDCLQTRCEGYRTPYAVEAAHGLRKVFHPQKAEGPEGHSCHLHCRLRTVQAVDGERNSENVASSINEAGDACPPRPQETSVTCHLESY